MQPFLSICIPQYSRFPFLLRQLEILHTQKYRDFEVCIADDQSPEKGDQRIRGFLEACQIPYRYEINPVNLRYDGNLRAAIDLAKGKYVLLMGNDDALADESSLELIAAQLQAASKAGALLANYRSVADGKVFRRVKRTGILGRGLKTALETFRDYSFVSGVALDRAKAQALATDRWDGSEQYQMYLASRIVSDGAELVGVAEVVIHCGLQIPGEDVDSYASRPRPRWREGLPKLNVPLAKEAGLVFDAVLPATRGPVRGVAWKIQRQIYQFTYGYWLFEYRRTLGWLYAAGFARAMLPSKTESHIPVKARNFWKTRIFFSLVTLAGFLVPRFIFETAKPFLYQLAKGKNR